MFTSSDKRPHYCWHRHGHIDYNACTHTHTDTKPLQLPLNRLSQIAQGRERLWKRKCACYTWKCCLPAHTVCKCLRVTISPQTCAAASRTLKNTVINSAHSGAGVKALKYVTNYFYCSTGGWTVKLSWPLGFCSERLISSSIKSNKWGSHGQRTQVTPSSQCNKGN